MNQNKGMLRFRESFRGYNKDDVNAYIEQIHATFSRREEELRAQVEAYQRQGSRSPADPAPEIEMLRREMETLRTELASCREENKTLKTQKDELQASLRTSGDASAEKSRLYDSVSAQVGNILIVANSNADKILSDAKGEADRIQSEAAADAERTRSEMEKKSQLMIADLDGRLKDVAEKCLAEYKMLVSEANYRFGEITNEMKAKSQDLAAAIEQQGKELESQITNDYVTARPADNSGSDE